MDSLWSLISRAVFGGFGKWSLGTSCLPEFASKKWSERPCQSMADSGPECTSSDTQTQYIFWTILNVLLTLNFQEESNLSSRREPTKPTIRPHAIAHGGSPKGTSFPFLQKWTPLTIWNRSCSPHYLPVPKEREGLCSLSGGKPTLNILVSCIVNITLSLDY